MSVIAEICQDIYNSRTWSRDLVTATRGKRGRVLASKVQRGEGARIALIRANLRYASSDPDETSDSDLLQEEEEDFV